MRCPKCGYDWKHAPETKAALSPREAARLVGCDPERIYQAVYAGKLRAFRLTPGRIRIPREALEAWMRELCETTSPAHTPTVQSRVAGQRAKK